MNNHQHEPGKENTIKLVGNHLYSTCRHCGREITAEEIDAEYLQDTQEIVVIEWRVNQ